MERKTEFHSVEFFRKVRDKQATILEGKSPEEIIVFYSEEKAKLLPTTARVIDIQGNRMKP